MFTFARSIVDLPVVLPPRRYFLSRLRFFMKVLFRLLLVAAFLANVFISNVKASDGFDNNYVLTQIDPENTPVSVEFLPDGLYWLVFEAKDGATWKERVIKLGE